MREVHQLSEAVEQAVLRQEGLLLPEDPQLPGLRLGGRKDFMKHNLVSVVVNLHHSISYLFKQS